MRSDLRRTTSTVVTTATSPTATDSDECETGASEELVVHWHPVSMEDAAGSVASQVGHFLALRLDHGTASAHDIAQASSGR